jgi:hypothetical protein
MNSEVVPLCFEIEDEVVRVNGSEPNTAVVRLERLQLSFTSQL